VYSSKNALDVFLLLRFPGHTPYYVSWRCRIYIENATEGSTVFAQSSSCNLTCNKFKQEMEWNNLFCRLRVQVVSCLLSYCRQVVNCLFRSRLLQFSSLESPVHVKAGYPGYLFPRQQRKSVPQIAMFSSTASHMRVFCCDDAIQ
jgi:hypothetical protein